MVECGHNVVQPDSHRRHAKLIDRRRWHPLQASPQIVAEQSGSPALKRRQSGGRVGSEPAHPPRQHAQGVAAVRRNLNKIERIGGHERISAEDRMDHRTIEKQAVRQPSQPHENIFRIRRRQQFLDQRQ